MKLLYIGDVVDQATRQIPHKYLPELRAQHRLDIIIANIEHAAGGLGITASCAEQLLAVGVVVSSIGNHAPTADARVLPNGSAASTATATTSCYDSVVGTSKNKGLARFSPNAAMSQHGQSLFVRIHCLE